jgi:hypothetical protein
MRIGSRFAQALAAAALSLAAQSALAAGDCALRAEKAALDMRVLQTELVVAALNCKQSDKYNTFVHKFESKLTDLGAAFRQYFVRVYGEAGETRMNELVTRLANAAVIRSWDWGAYYCPTEAQMFDYVLWLKPDQLVSFAASRPYIHDHDVQGCAGTPQAPVQAEAAPQSGTP